MINFFPQIFKNVNLAGLIRRTATPANVQQMDRLKLALLSSVYHRKVQLPNSGPQL